jgi:translation initiation factor IF-2
MSQKLIKVARELNVGLHSIVETLRSKGFDLEEKPTTEITDEMMTVLQKEYQRDLAIKQEADKLSRPLYNKPSPPPASPVVPPVPVAARPNLLPPREPVEKPIAPKVEETPSATPPPPAQETPAPASETPSQPVRERPQLRIIGRIDLPPKHGQKPKEEPKKEEKPPMAEPSVVAEKNAPEAPVLPVKEEAGPIPTADPTTSVPAPEKKAPAPAPATGASEEAPGEAGSDALYRADSTPLRGLKILGRINLETRKEEDNERNRRNRREREKGRSGNTGGTPNRPPAAGGDPAARPPGQTAGEGGDGAQGDARRKRKRKKVQQPITAASLQNNMANNQGDKRGGDRRNDKRGPNTGGTGNRPGGAGTAQGTGVKKEVSQKDIEEQIRQTMARLGAGASRKRQKVRRDKRDMIRDRAEKEEIARTKGEKILQVTEFISVSDLASLMDIKPAEIIRVCMSLGSFVSINQRLDAELIEVVAGEFGYEAKFISAEEQVEVAEEEVDDPKDLRPRQPIVTVMGHVDHGKTSLLDFIRNANVASGEAGGITQHIGAYEVMTTDGDGNEREITFLDTPGHEAFTAMRARGAKVTDIAIIVIAADDSIMPQSREAISHAQAAGVPIVFAINKIDKAGADPERIKNELAQMNLLVEEWGGKIQSQDISAKKGTNVDKLLEKVLLEADMLELKANPSRRAVGTVLEASLDKGRGYVAKILVENGTLNDGDPIIAGEFSGKVKAMFNERGKKIKEAGPASPVLVLGLPGAPQAGEKIKVAASDAEAKEIAAKRAQIIREQSNRASKRISLEEIGRRLALGNFKELNVIVKGDVDGSIEALSDSLIKLSIEKVAVNVIHKAVGQIVDSDVMLASASDAIIVGFQVRPSLTARRLAEKEGVEIKLYSIIYEAIEEIKAAIEGMLEPTKEEEIMGQVEIREVYKISKIGTVAGCYVQEGKVNRNHYVRLIRDGIVVYPVNPGQHAELASLKRFKEDIKEVKNGMECGLTIRNFNDIKVGDVVETYIINEVKATL